MLNWHIGERFVRASHFMIGFWPQGMAVAARLVGTTQASIGKAGKHPHSQYNNGHQASEQGKPKTGLAIFRSVK